MSLDRRLRAELEREAQEIDSNVERNLGIVEARSRRRSSIGTSSLLLAAAVVVAATIVRFGISAPGVGGPQASTQATSASPLPSSTAAYGAIAGTYTVTLDAANASVAQYKLGGTWTMRLAATGQIFLSPPVSFGTGTSSLSGLAFTLTGDRFRNDIFYNDYCNSVGTYSWALTPAQLRFAPVGETCGIRQTLLSMLPWQVSP